MEDNHLHEFSAFREMQVPFFKFPPRCAFDCKFPPSFYRMIFPLKRLLLLFTVFHRSLFSKHKTKGQKSSQFSSRFENLNLKSKMCLLIKKKKSLHTHLSPATYIVLIRQIISNVTVLWLKKKKETHV